MSHPRSAATLYVRADAAELMAWEGSVAMQSCGSGTNADYFNISNGSLLLANTALVCDP
jgi:hypothetical protein